MLSRAPSLRSGETRYIVYRVFPLAIWGPLEAFRETLLNLSHNLGVSSISPLHPPWLINSPLETTTSLQLRTGRVGPDDA